MPENSCLPKNHPVSTVQTAIISCFGLLARNTIPIWFPAKLPQLGTIGKNHIQSSLSFV